MAAAMRRPRRSAASRVTYNEDDEIESSEPEEEEVAQPSPTQPFAVFLGCCSFAR